MYIYIFLNILDHGISLEKYTPNLRTHLLVGKEGSSKFYKHGGLGSLFYQCWHLINNKEPVSHSISGHYS